MSRGTRYHNMHPTQIIHELTVENEHLHQKCRNYKRTVRQLNHGINKLKGLLYNKFVRTPKYVEEQRERIPEDCISRNGPFPDIPIIEFDKSQPVPGSGITSGPYRK